MQAPDFGTDSPEVGPQSILGIAVYSNPCLAFGAEELTMISTPTPQHCTESRRVVTEQPAFPPLEFVTRPTVPTEQAAHYLNRRPQTLRKWSMTSGTGPVSCIRINGRLAWPVAELRRVLGVSP